MQRTAHPGVYRRGGSYVAVYRRAGRQRKEAAPTFTEARALKQARDAEAQAERLGPTLHNYALIWVSRHNGLGRDSVRDHTRVEYERLLATFALRYFSSEVRLDEIDRKALRGFVTWLTAQTGRRGRLCDRSVRNAVTPLRVCLEHAASKGLLSPDVVKGGLMMLPSRRGGAPWHYEEGRFLTRTELAQLMAEIPQSWQPFFSLLASTGLRVSEAIALRWRDVDLAPEGSRLRVRRSIVRGVLGAPKSRYGARSIPVGEDLSRQLLELRSRAGRDEDFIFHSRTGRPLSPDSVRSRVLIPAIERAGIRRVGFHAFRHTCASLLIERGVSPLRLQRWMGHHSAAYTLDVYGHLIDGELSPALDLSAELSISA
jgi:integrase